jgi:fatty acid synthase subunit beta
LTARNFEGRGVHVIVLGEKGKGGAELYDSKNVKFEDWWTKKWTSKLVKTRWVDVFRGLLPVQG